MNDLPTADASALADAIAALQSNYEFLDKLVITLEPPLPTSVSNVTIRGHYLPFRNGRPMTGELLDIVRAYICNFALSRSEINEVHDAAKTSTPQDAMILYNQLRDTAADIFIKAQQSTNRNGECGELLLYLLIEWFMKAPQIVAKMSLKTSASMPVHGSDGIHLKYDEATGKLWFVWGESKLHATLSGALGDALASVAEAIEYDKQKTDINLVRRNFDASGLPPSVKQALLDHLNPLKDAYVSKLDVSACLIGFDFDGFASLSGVAADQLDATFAAALRTELQAALANLGQMINAKGLAHHQLELFFLPFESVSQLRVDFQNLIGWKS